jgi:redox-sensitive bicupin YhaK (pirin superfamily)
MAVTIILCKEQLTKENYNGAIKERKVLGFPQEKSPLQPYSSLFYWSYMCSDYGCMITEHPHVGFEILTYVLKGGFDTFDKEHDQWVRLGEGDIGIVKAGKGIRHSEKMYPRTEILQLWFDPDLNQFRNIDPILNQFASHSFPVNNSKGRITRIFNGKNAPIKLNSKDVSIQMQELEAGFHKIVCPEDAVISGYIIEGFIELDDRTLGKHDFFKVEELKEINIASLTESKIFMVISPFKPKYQTYAAMHM